MRKYSLSITALIIAMCSSAPFARPVPAKQPKLMLLVVIDQFRYDYLLRFRNQYTGGLNRLLNEGAVFDNEGTWGQWGWSVTPSAPRQHTRR